MVEELLSVQQVARVLGLSITTVYSWVYKGRLPFVKIGRRTLFRPSEIERWVSERSRREKPRKLENLEN